MNIKEMNVAQIVEANAKAGKTGWKLEDAKELWTAQEKALKDDALVVKTFSNIKLLECLAKLDKDQKVVDQTCTVGLATKANGKKWAEYITLYKEGNAVLNLTYADVDDGLSKVWRPDGEVIAQGKGWKTVKAVFQGLYPKAVKAPKAETPVEEPVAEETVKDTDPLPFEPVADAEVEELVAAIDEPKAKAAKPAKKPAKKATK